MSKYDLYRNTICKEDDNDYILLFKDEESAKNVYDEFNQKDQRIAEFEEENERLKLVEKLYKESSIGHIYEEFNRLQEENDELKKQLKNAIVPKFKVGDKVWFIVDGKIEKGKILENSKHKLCRFVYSITGGGIGYYSENYIFATEEEAQQNLKELEGK